MTDIYIFKAFIVGAASLAFLFLITFALGATSQSTEGPEVKDGGSMMVCYQCIRIKGKPWCNVSDQFGVKVNE